MTTQYEQHKKGKTIVSTIFLIIGILILVSFIFMLFSWMGKTDHKSIELYEEWCPKLNTTLLEPEQGYYYTPKCMIENNGIVKLFLVSKINGEYKLREVFPE